MTSIESLILQSLQAFDCCFFPSSISKTPEVPILGDPEISSLWDIIFEHFPDGWLDVENGNSIHRFNSQSTLDPNSNLTDTQVHNLLKSILKNSTGSIEELVNHLHGTLVEHGKIHQVSSSTEDHNSTEMSSTVPSEQGSKGSTQEPLQSGDTTVQRNDHASTLHEVILSFRLLLDSAYDGGVVGLSEETVIAAIEMVSRFATALILDLSEDNEDIKYEWIAALLLLICSVKMTIALLSTFPHSKRVVKIICRKLSQSTTDSYTNEDYTHMIVLAITIKSQSYLRLLLCCAHIYPQFFGILSDASKFSRKVLKLIGESPVAECISKRKWFSSKEPTLSCVEIVENIPSTLQESVFNLDFAESCCYAIDISFTFLNLPSSSCVFSPQLSLHSFRILVASLLLLSFSLKVESLSWACLPIANWFLGIDSLPSNDSFQVRMLDKNTNVFKLGPYLSFLHDCLDPPIFYIESCSLQQFHMAYSCILFLLNIVKSLAYSGLSASPLKLVRPSGTSSFGNSLVGVLIRTCRILDSHTRSEMDDFISIRDLIDLRYPLHQSGFVLSLLSHHEDFYSWIGNKTNEISTVIGMALGEIDGIDKTYSFDISKLPYLEVCLNFCKSRSLPVESLLYLLDQKLADLYVRILTFSKPQIELKQIWRVVDALACLFARLESEESSGAPSTLYRIGASSIINRLSDFCIQAEDEKNDQLEPRLRSVFRYQVMKVISSVVLWQSRSELELWLRQPVFTCCLIRFWLTSDSTEICCWSLDVLICLIKSCETHILLDWICQVRLIPTKPYTMSVLDALLLACNRSVTTIRARAVISSLTLYIATAITKHEDQQSGSKALRSYYDTALNKLEVSVLSSLDAGVVQGLLSKWEALRILKQPLKPETREKSMQCWHEIAQPASQDISADVYNIYRSALSECLDRIFDFSEIDSTEGKTEYFSTQPWTADELRSSFQLLFPRPQASASVLAFICRSVRHKLKEEDSVDSLPVICSWIIGEVAQLIVKYLRVQVTELDCSKNLPESHFFETEKSVDGLFLLLFDLFKTLLSSTVISTQTTKATSELVNLLTPLIQLQQLLFRFFIDPSTSTSLIRLGMVSTLLSSYSLISQHLEATGTYMQSFFDKGEFSVIVLVLVFRFFSKLAEQPSNNPQDSIGEWVATHVPLCLQLIQNITEYQLCSSEPWFKPISLRLLYTIATRLRTRTVSNQPLDATSFRSLKSAQSKSSREGVYLLRSLYETKYLIVTKEENYHIESVLQNMLKSTRGTSMVSHWCCHTIENHSILHRLNVGSSIKLIILDSLFSLITKSGRKNHLIPLSDSIFNPPTFLSDEPVNKSFSFTTVLAELLEFLSVRIQLSSSHSISQESHASPDIVGDLLVTTRLLLSALFTCSPIELLVASDKDASMLPKFILRTVFPIMFSSFKELHGNTANNEEHQSESINVFSVILAILCRCGVQHFVSYLSAFGIPNIQYGGAETLTVLMSRSNDSVDYHPVSTLGTSNFNFNYAYNGCCPRWNSSHDGLVEHLFSSKPNGTTQTVATPLAFVQWSPLTIWSVCIICFMGLQIQDCHLLVPLKPLEENILNLNTSAEENSESYWNGFDSEMSELILTVLWSTLRHRFVQFILGTEVELSEDHAKMKETLNHALRQKRNKVVLIGNSIYTNKKRAVQLTIINPHLILPWISMNFPASLNAVANTSELLKCNEFDKEEVEVCKGFNVRFSKSCWVNAFSILMSLDPKAESNYDCLHALLSLFIGTIGMGRYLDFEHLQDELISLKKNEIDKKLIERQKEILLQTQQSYKIISRVLDLTVIRLLETTIKFLQLADLKATLFTQPEDITLTTFSRQPFITVLVHYILSSLFLLAHSPTKHGKEQSFILIRLKAAATVFSLILWRLLRTLSYPTDNSSVSMWTPEHLVVQTAVAVAYINLEQLICLSQIEHGKVVGARIKDDMSAVSTETSNFRNNVTPLYFPSTGIVGGAEITSLRNLITVSDLSVLDVIKDLIDGFILLDIQKIVTKKNTVCGVANVDTIGKEKIERGKKDEKQHTMMQPFEVPTFLEGEPPVPIEPPVLCVPIITTGQIVQGDAFERSQVTDVAIQTEVQDKQQATSSLVEPIRGEIEIQTDKVLSFSHDNVASSLLQTTQAVQMELTESNPFQTINESSQSSEDLRRILRDLEVELAILEL